MANFEAIRSQARKYRAGDRHDLPMPPIELRGLAGPVGTEAYDNPEGSRVFPELVDPLYKEVFDFGCGCGRIARQLIQQDSRPQRYVGIDINRAEIDWCRAHLTPHAANFEFLHHDVFNRELNRGEGKPLMDRFPVDDSSFTLVIAFSVFTHLTQSQADHYLSEAARVLRSGGVLYSTWLLFDRRDLAVMQLFPNASALYVDYEDPSQAVIFDKRWLSETAARAGLQISSIVKPKLRGYQWIVLMTPVSGGFEQPPFPVDDAPIGVPQREVPVCGGTGSGQ